MTNTTGVQASKLLVASQRFASCEPLCCELRARELQVASLRHRKTTSLRVSRQQAYELYPFNLTICKAAI